jgi:hypothetical protein
MSSLAGNPRSQPAHKGDFGGITTSWKRRSVVTHPKKQIVEICPAVLVGLDSTSEQNKKD